MIEWWKCSLFCIENAFIDFPNKQYLALHDCVCGQVTDVQQQHKQVTVIDKQKYTNVTLTVTLYDPSINAF